MDDKRVSEMDLRRTVQIQRVVNALARGCNVKQACKEVGINRDTWYVWRRAGLVQDMLNARYEDLTSGTKDLVVDALGEGIGLLAELALGKVPPGTDIGGVLSPRDVLAAQWLLFDLWKALGGGAEGRERERLSEQLRALQIDIRAIRIEMTNLGTEAQSMLVPVGARLPPIIEDRAEE